MSQLLSEIHEQPAVLRRLLAQEFAHVQQIAAQIRARDADRPPPPSARGGSSDGMRYILIAARGTSDNAARYAQYLFGAHNHLTVALATPSLFTRYHAPPRLDGALVIGISQSGASPDLIAVVAEGRRQGCLTLAITNVADSALARVADNTILLHADTEKSIAATKTYTAQLLALAMLSTALSDDTQHAAELAHVPEWVADVLSPLSQQGRGGGGEGVTAAAQLLAASDRCVVIARGYNYATAYEVALKMKELAHVAAEPYSSADFWHGPIALIERGFPALVINPSGDVYSEVQEVLTEIIARGARPVVISDRDESLKITAAPIALPSHIPEWLSPVVAVVPGQQLAYDLSRARGYDPDRPRGIQKVTRTV